MEMLLNSELLKEIETTDIVQSLLRYNLVHITSSYKGIILTQPITILKVLPGRVIFQAPEPTLCFTLKERVYLYSPESREIISGRVSNLDPCMGRLELSNLAFTGRCWNERKYDRVQPKDPIYVYVEHKRALVRANLDNLSVGGMSLMGSTDREKVLHTDHDAVVRLTLQLPGENAHLNLHGKIVHARQTGKLVMVGVQLIANIAMERRINRYAMARKAEILADLKQAYQTICEGPSIQNLFI
jgi:hypothetical protein